jgi:hypothetical protein
MRSATILAWLLWLCAVVTAAPPATAERILFVGNSFTYGGGSPVRFFHPELVHDLNRDGLGGVPSLFKIFALQAGLDWDVSLETEAARDFGYHLANKKAELAGAWDVVVLQDYSTLEKERPGDAGPHIRDAARLAALFRATNPSARVLLETTWPRADMIYPTGAPWRGKPVRAMLDDLARANALALAGSRDLSGSIPVGEAWMRAMEQGVADPNPYDGIGFGKLDLWTWDHYHASTAGYYLAALVIFGRVTGYDVRRLGPRERAADELGMSGIMATTLQRIASETLGRAGATGGRPARERGAPSAPLSRKR